MLRGIVTPSVTPMDERGNIDYEGSRRHLEFLIENGVNGILFLGSIGEFFTLTPYQRREYATFVLDEVRGRVPVLIGTGDTIVKEAADFTRFVGEAGADGAVIITPYYFALPQQALYQYYATIAAASDTPMYLYNFPDRTGASLAPETVARLARQFPQIVGIKDTVDNISHTRALCEACRELPEFAVFSGFDEYFLLNLLNGGAGLIGGLSNVAPGLLREIYEAFVAGDMQRAAARQRTVCKLMALYDVSTPFVGALKYAAALACGGFEPWCGAPVAALDEGQRERVRAILADAGVAFTADRG